MDEGVFVVGGIAVSSSLSELSELEDSEGGLTASPWYIGRTTPIGGIVLKNGGF